MDWIGVAWGGRREGSRDCLPDGLFCFRRCGCLPSPYLSSREGSGWGEKRRRAAAAAAVLPYLSWRRA